MLPPSIGSFEFMRELGRGGMGEVFLGRDTRLDRLVAIKALPEHLATDPDRLARFQREAKVLASLNHPGIGAIHGLEESAGRQYLILEYVEGETLADRLKTGPIAIEEALVLARQMCEALEGAHDKGVVHRDLKPGNVMITGDGAAKVLDFGLARVDASPSSRGADPSLENSPTLTSPPPLHSPSIPGVIMGTAGYMSPEQARGKSVDRRSDIFSFGCVLYEMLTARMPFPGETVTDSLGAILHREPDWSALPARTPRRVRELLANCLAKDRRHRLHDIGDARLEIERALSGREWLANDATSSPRTSPWRRPGWALVAVAIVLGAALGWYITTQRTGDSEAGSAGARAIRFTLEPPAGFAFAIASGQSPSLAVSPAGDKIVFAAEAEGVQHLFIRDSSTVEPQLIPSTDGAVLPFFSPDGKWLAFYAKGRMQKVPVAGGPAVTICRIPGAGSAWLDDGTIVFGNERGLWRVAASGGEPTPVLQVNARAPTSEGTTKVLGFNRVSQVPGQPYVLASIWDGDELEDYAIVKVSLHDGALTPLWTNATDGRVVAPNRIVFCRGSSIMAAPFDADRGVMTGEAEQIIGAVSTNRWGDSGYWAASDASNGTLAYVPGSRSGLGRRLVSVDASGKSTPIMDGVDSLCGGLRVSPDGKDVSVLTLRSRLQLWRFDLARRSFSLVSSDGEAWAPIWSPDGDSLIFTQVTPGQPLRLLRKSARDSSATAHAIPLEHEQSDFVVALDATPDGSTLILQVQGVAPLGRLATVRADATEPRAPVQLAGTKDGDHLARLSPDGRLLAFFSTESGNRELYVRSFDGQGPRVRVSNSGSIGGCWSRDGKRLFFLDPRGVMHASEVQVVGELQASPPVRLFDSTGIATTSVWDTPFDVLEDGTFLMVEPAAWETQPTRINVVLNWGEALLGK
ncbi:MAG: serine/threonine-protein kinase [Phycisphaerae bacterium]|nr:serine/threonine-protein kinase [Phycisphaerae bacterium]